MASFAASATIGSSAWTGLVGTGPVGWAAGVGLMVVGAIIDAQVTSKLFAGGHEDKSAQNRLLGLPVNNQEAGEPRVWAIGSRVRVPVHAIWQSEKRISQSGGGGMKASAALSNNVYVDCALAVNDRQTLRIAQITGQGKLLTYSTRNLNDITTSEITVTDSGGNLVLSMQSTENPDWSSKLEVYDVVKLEGFVYSVGTLNINDGYWRVATVVGHTSTPSVLTLSPLSGQTVSGISATAGTPEAPGKVTRIDDALVHSDWVIFVGSIGGGTKLRLSCFVTPSHPAPDRVFVTGDYVTLGGFTPASINGPATVVSVTATLIILDLQPASRYGVGPYGSGSTSDSATIEFATTRLFPDGIFPPTFVPADYYHDGASDQDPDATIESAEGVGDVPAYRGIAYQVYEDFNVTIFGGSIPPQMTALIDPDASMSWGEAVVETCGRLGIGNAFVDTTDVPAIPFAGMFLRGATIGIQALQPMMVAQQLVTQERDGVIAFFHIDAADAVQIRNGASYTDLISQPGIDAKIAYEDVADADLPTSIGIRHQDPDTQYTEGYQFYGVRNPSASTAENRQEVDLSNLVLTRKQAANLAGTLIRRAYINSRQIRMQLPASYLHVLENDLLTVTDDDGNDLTVRVVRRDIGANFLVQVTAVVEEVDLDVVGSPVQSNAGNVNRPPIRLAPIIGRVLDIPPIRDAEAFTPGLVLCAGAMGDGPWAGCSVYRSINAGADWVLVGTLSFQSTVGHSSSILAAASPSETLGSAVPVWDAVSTLDIDVDSFGTTFPLVSTDDAAVLGGMNWFTVRREDGTTEIIGARDIVQNSETSYTLSYLLRGIRGTYTASGTDAGIGSEVTGISFLSASDGLFHDLSGLVTTRTLEFRFVPPGYDVSDVESVALTANWQNCLPFPVRDITKSINGSNDVRFTVDNWTRTNVPISQVGPYPMDETYETYRFDLYDPTGTGLRYSRTISAEGTGTPTLRDKWVEFASAEITLAGYTPGPSETFFIDVVQVGDYGDSPSVLQEL